MEFQNVFGLILKHKKVFLVSLACSLAVIFLIIAFNFTEFSAESRLIVATKDESSYPSVYSAPEKRADKDTLIEKQIEMIKDPSVINDVIKDLDIRNESGGLVNYSDMLKKIKVLRIGDTNTIKITVKYGSADKASMIANALSRQFVKWKKQMKKQGDESFRKYLEGFLGEIKKRQEAVRAALPKLKKNAVLSSEQKEMLSNSAGLEIEKTRTSLLLGRARSLSITESYSEGVQAMQRKMQILDAEIAKFREREAGIPAGNKTKYELAKENTVLNAIYPMIVKNLDETKLNVTMVSDAPGIMTEASEAKDAVPGKSWLTFLSGFILALMFSSAVVFIVEYLDRSIKTSDELEHLAKIKIIGIIPRLNIDENIQAYSLPQEINRLFDSIVSHLTLGEKNIIAFSSPIEDAARSFAAACFAVSLARSGKNVLLIDAKTKHHVQDILFGLKDVKGLSDLILSGANAEETVHEAAIKGLKIIPFGSSFWDGEEATAGKIAPALQAVIAEHEFVIIDIDPLEKTAPEATKFLGVANNSILVVSSGTVTKAQVSDAIAMLQHSKTDLAGAIFFSHKIDPIERHKTIFHGKRDHG